MTYATIIKLILSNKKLIGVILIIAILASLYYKYTDAIDSAATSALEAIELQVANETWVEKSKRLANALLDRQDIINRLDNIPVSEIDPLQSKQKQLDSVTKDINNASK